MSDANDPIYQLTPKGLRFVKLQRKFEDGSIMAHERAERLAHIAEARLELGPEDRRGYDIGEQMRRIFGETSTKRPARGGCTQ